MTSYILFFAVILLSNIIHGITGFAGTLLAMPFSLMLVGYGVAKPVLNVLGILSGVYVVLSKDCKIDWKELKKIVIIMALGMLGGILIKDACVGREEILYKILGSFIIILGIQGIYKSFFQGKQGETKKESDSPLAANVILILAGIVHGIFVSGGALLVGYMTKRVKDKVAFRSTISTVWIFLNGLLLVDDIRSGLWTGSLIGVQLISIPFLFGGMYIGSKLYVKMSQQLFMKITYVLLVISGISLFIK